MIIETKFNIGDEVYTIDENRIVKYPVKEIRYEFNRVCYDLLINDSKSCGNRKLVRCEEAKCFASLDEFYKAVNEKFKKIKTINLNQN